jgi:Patatin-like phospholipase
MPINEEARALSTEEMLAEEANEIHGPDTVRLSASLQSEAGHIAHQNRMRLNADDRTGGEIDREIVNARNELYRSLNGLKRAALCFSGGGIRSATFCLGILQALAARDATPFDPKPDKPQPGGATGITPATSLLGRFHYLSTVSGGGYVGSWLSSWRKRDSFATILHNLTGRPSGTDVEPPEISWLRAYSNYLTPRIGIGSADTWAALAIIVRNLVLNWLIIIPVLCVVLLALKIIVTGAVWVAHQESNDWLVRVDAAWRTPVPIRKCLRLSNDS